MDMPIIEDRASQSALLWQVMTVGGGGQGRFHAVSLCSLRQVVFGRGGVIRAGLGVLGPGMVFPVDLEQAFGLTCV